MKRGIIYNNGYSIIIPNDEIWMTSWEIADLFYVTPVSINHAIKRILKEEVLIESQIHRYICLENGNHADGHRTFHIVPKMADTKNIHSKPF